MTNSMMAQLERNMECEDLLECMHGLKNLDRKVYTVLSEAEEPLTVDDVAEETDRERSTAYRSVQRLLEAGLAEKEQINYDQGGYCHVFYPTDPTEVTQDMQRLLNDWYAQMGRLIQEFEETYGERVAPVPEQ